MQNFTIAANRLTYAWILFCFVFFVFFVFFFCFFFVCFLLLFFCFLNPFDACS